MAKDVPESLETIKIKINYDNNWPIENFFDRCYYKRGGENKNIILKRTERCTMISDDYNVETIYSY
ncbi:7502_t:CDS:2 [Diversispora eburnea]|uniref:7502_t:CDS:1 n=1 Tax=Diversispora eburnea TaxID=1213867 RepID=A0A9N9FVZ1_9GLOM|nr:7502_t:CDS:2 [Diversispora eburnea]